MSTTTVFNITQQLDQMRDYIARIKTRDPAQNKNDILTLMQIIAPASGTKIKILEKKFIPAFLKEGQDVLQNIVELMAEQMHLDSENANDFSDILASMIFEDRAFAPFIFKYLGNAPFNRKQPDAQRINLELYRFCIENDFDLLTQDVLGKLLIEACFAPSDLAADAALEITEMDVTDTGFAMQLDPGAVKYVRDQIALELNYIKQNPGNGIIHTYNLESVLLTVLTDDLDSRDDEQHINALLGFNGISAKISAANLPPPPAP